MVVLRTLAATNVLNLNLIVFPALCNIIRTVSIVRVTKDKMVWTVLVNTQKPVVANPYAKKKDQKMTKMATTWNSCCHQTEPSNDQKIKRSFVAGHRKSAVSHTHRTLPTNLTIKSPAVDQSIAYK